ncbi:MAG TPA: DUF4492 domain-containing protein [Bacteroidales bacterium]|nr:DUF4492 domain-containing protein [Bacteroidales bacterium]HRR94255.1 DUF4492 domain-containing protein [Bacteroidales bacterium]HRT90175.1 DUF4492 domain-containing protein [Bacteroidales bacterium]
MARNSAAAIFTRVFSFYRDGFRNMSDWGRKVWIIIIIKLFVIFVLLRLLFFPDLLKKNFENDSERGNYIREHLINSE